jgi:peroxiredoxin
MRLKPIVFFLIVGSVAGYFVYLEATREGKVGIINVGQKAPDFTIKDENGHEVRLSDYRGKLVFLNFWATWCAPCVVEMPEMELLHNGYKGRDFQMIGITVDLNWDTVKEFYERYNLTFPSYLDPGRQVAGLYKVYKQPETFLIDPNGYVIKHYIGAERWANPRVMSYIESLIPEAGQPASATK